MLGVGLFKMLSRHCSHRHATGCFHLDLHGKVKGHIASAKLWVFKNRDWNDKQQSFTISELDQGTSYNYTKLRPKNIVQRIETDVKSGWLQFNITTTIRKWLDKPHLNHGFSIRCKTCHTKSHRVVFGSKEGYRPLLIIHFGNENRRRERRSIDCTPGETLCCRQQFYIDFGAIEDFLQILQPKGLWANYCTGSCYDGTMAHYNHTTLMQTLRFRSTSVNDSFAETLMPCCAPISYATKSLLVIDEHGDIKYSEVPNISVHACGCI
ncbi:inhibin beta B chain [Patella vulgata]|uniref:inhibin beta B chain n=1 Tax=Patella vulgata TaxID=6465 RepID=UPI00217F51CE|nr:inhibin beta B chain [Patella vulgata]